MKTRILIKIFLIIILAEALLIFLYKPVFIGKSVNSEISVTRVLPEKAALNQEFEVILRINILESSPAAIGITEIVPENWTVGQISGMDYAKKTDSSLEILEFSLSGSVKTKDIKYKITPRSRYGEFSGTWESVNPDVSGDLEGDTSLVIDEAEYCGNGACNTGETCSSCPEDCGTCLSSDKGGGGGGGAETTLTNTLTCKENWICTDWSECINGQKTRSCTDLNNCRTLNDKPLESASCNPVIKAAEQTIEYTKRQPLVPISIILSIAIIIIILCIIRALKVRRILKFLSSHIEKAKKQGYTLEQIKESLRQKGYSKKIIRKIK